MPESYVLDVEQDFVGALAVPHLVAGITGIGHDRADGALGPGDAVAVGIARRVVGGRAGDAVSREAFGDGEDGFASTAVCCMTLVQPPRSRLVPAGAEFPRCPRSKVARN